MVLRSVRMQRWHQSLTLRTECGRTSKSKWTTPLCPIEVGCIRIFRTLTLVCGHHHRVGHSEYFERYLFRTVFFQRFSLVPTQFQHWTIRRWYTWTLRQSSMWWMTQTKDSNRVNRDLRKARFRNCTFRSRPKFWCRINWSCRTWTYKLRWTRQKMRSESCLARSPLKDTKNWPLVIVLSCMYASAMYTCKTKSNYFSWCQVHLHQSTSERSVVRWTDATVDARTVSVSNSALCDELFTKAIGSIHNIWSTGC